MNPRKSSGRNHKWNSWRNPGFPGGILERIPVRISGVICKENLEESNKEFPRGINEEIPRGMRNGNPRDIFKQNLLLDSVKSQWENSGWNLWEERRSNTERNTLRKPGRNL